MVLRILPAVFLVVFAASCAGSRPANLGVAADGKLAPCPTSPNCVSSEATEAGHAIEPIALAGEPEQAWAALRRAVASMPRTHVVTDSGDYLYAECSSALFGFVDDLELHRAPAGSTVTVRSASRLGYSDMGANRRRVEDLRALGSAAPH